MLKQKRTYTVAIILVFMFSLLSLPCFAVAKKKVVPKKVAPKKVVTPVNAIPKVQVIQTGKLTGTITWQYNDYVGTKPDVKAKIYLFPKNLNQLNLSDVDFNALSAIGVIPTSLKGKVFYAEANGNGNFQINSIPSGEYRIYIVSQKTHRDLENEDDTNYIKGVMSQYIPDDKIDDFLLVTNATMNKFYTDTVEIIPNDSIDVSHDFGNTYF